MTKPQALYRFFNADGSLLYVGISADPGARWKQHRDDKPWWSQVTLVTLEPYPDRESVLEAERRAIIAEQPRYNVIHARQQCQPEGTTSTTWGVWAGDMPDDCHHLCAPAASAVSANRPTRRRTMSETSTAPWHHYGPHEEF